MKAQNKTMKTIIRSNSRPLSRALCTLLLGLAAAPVLQASILYEADYLTGQILEFNPGGVASTFASGLNLPVSLAFDASGNLFVGNTGNGQITKVTPGGVESVFASGLATPEGLAFNASGDLFEDDYASGQILEFTPGGTESIFASGLNAPLGLAFDASGNLLQIAAW